MVSQNDIPKGLQSLKYCAYKFEKKVPGFTNSEVDNSNVVFFIPPPIEIGEVMNAYSDYHDNDTFFSPRKRIAIKLFFLLISLLVGYTVAKHIPVELPGTIIVFILSILVIGTRGIIIVYKQNSYKCIYLGKKGLAVFTMSDDINNISMETLIFNEHIVSQANTFTLTELIIIKTHSYSYTWYPDRYNIAYDKKIFSISGENGGIYCFVGMKTDKQWIDYLYNEHVLKEINQNGLYFYHSGIILLANSFTFYQGKEKITINYSDLDKLIIEKIRTENSESIILTSYLCIKQRKTNVIIAPLSVPIPSLFEGTYYNTGLLLKHIEHIKCQNLNI